MGRSFFIQTLENMYITKLRDSEQLKTTFALYCRAYGTEQGANELHALEEDGEKELGSVDEGSTFRCQKRQNREWSSHQTGSRG